MGADVSQFSNFIERLICFSLRISRVICLIVFKPKDPCSWSPLRRPYITKANTFIIVKMFIYIRNFIQIFILIKDSGRIWLNRIAIECLILDSRKFFYFFYHNCAWDNYFMCIFGWDSLLYTREYLSPEAYL